MARDELKEGDVRRAVWIAHRVLLGLLDEQGAIKFAGWKTNSITWANAPQPSLVCDFCRVKRSL